jgi:DNA-binding response OmpR family regulator
LKVDILKVMNQPMPETILVVDDEEKILEVVASYLENSGFRVLRASTGLRALEIFAQDMPDLVVLDLMLPDISGEVICQRLRQQSTLPILMLTARADEDSILNGLAIGADDYMVKPFSPRQLVARVQALLRRTRDLPERTAQTMIFAGGLTIDLDAHQVLLESRPVLLTPTEFDLLSTLARSPGRSFSRAELVSLALGADYEGFDRTIDSHIKNLRQKLEANPRDPRWIQTVFGVGYRFVGDRL